VCVLCVCVVWGVKKGGLCCAWVKYNKTKKKETTKGYGGEKE